MNAKNLLHRFELGDEQVVDIPSARDPLIGKVVSDRYRILERIGLGGFGAVYKVQHIRLDKIFALKVLFEHTHQNPRMIKRFEREARATCRIGHENIVDISDFSRDRRVGYFFVMEYLIGDTLCERLRNTGPQKMGHLVRIGSQIADALAATHAKGIIHRDLKPDNVVLVQKRNHEDFVKILDFGIAAMNDLEEDVPRLTRHGTMLGTPSYMAPEQAEGKPADQRADIYSLGIILYEMATGKVPFRNTSSLAVLEMHRSTPAVPPTQASPELEIPTHIEQIIMRALRKPLSERYQTMREIYNDLIAADKLLPDIEEDPTESLMMVDTAPAPAQDDVDPEDVEWLDDDVVVLDSDAVEVIAADEWSNDHNQIAETQLLSVVNHDNIDELAANVDPDKTMLATPQGLKNRRSKSTPSNHQPTGRVSPQHATKRTPVKPIWQRPVVLIVAGFALMALIYGVVHSVASNTKSKRTNGKNAARAEVTQTETQATGATVTTELSPPKSESTLQTPTPTVDTTKPPVENLTTVPVIEGTTAPSPKPRTIEEANKQPPKPVEVTSTQGQLYVRLTVQSVPAGASVLWNGKNEGKTPLTVRVSRSEKDGILTLRRKGYASQKQTIRPTEAQTIRISLRKKTKRIQRSPQPTPTYKPKKQKNRRYDFF
jgi:serine/threonine protein kinase